jgi:hypothetical protein
LWSWRRGRVFNDPLHLQNFLHLCAQPESLPLLPASIQNAFGFLREFNSPPLDKHPDNYQRSFGDEPALPNLLEALEALDDVALGRLLLEVKEVDGACRVNKVPGDVADLPQAVAALVEA